MPTYEFKVIPAPKKGLKAKGVKGADAQFANALATAMNELGADGWDYVRADTLPSEERQGLTGKTTVFRNVLVFRREVVAAEVAEEAPDAPTAALPPPATAEEAPVPAPERVADTLARPMREIGPATRRAEPAPDGDGPRHAAE